MKTISIGAIIVALLFVACETLPTTIDPEVQDVLLQRGEMLHPMSDTLILKFSNSVTGNITIQLSDSILSNGTSSHLDIEVKAKKLIRIPVLSPAQHSLQVRIQIGAEDKSYSLSVKPRNIVPVITMRDNVHQDDTATVNVDVGGPTRDVELTLSASSGTLYGGSNSGVSTTLHLDSAGRARCIFVGDSSRPLVQIVARYRGLTTIKTISTR